MFFFWIPYYKETSKLASEVPSDRSITINIVQVHRIYTQQFQGPQHTGSHLRFLSFKSVQFYMKIRVGTGGWSKNMFQNGSQNILKHNQDTFLTNTQNNPKTIYSIIFQTVKLVKKSAKTRLKSSFKPHVQLFILGLMRLRTFYLRRCVLRWRSSGMAWDWHDFCYDLWLVLCLLWLWMTIINNIQ